MCVLGRGAREQPLRTHPNTSEGGWEGGGQGTRAAGAAWPASLQPGSRQLFKFLCREGPSVLAPRYSTTPWSAGAASAAGLRTRLRAGIRLRERGIVQCEQPYASWAAICVMGSSLAAGWAASQPAHAARPPAYAAQQPPHAPWAHTQQELVVVCPNEPPQSPRFLWMMYIGDYARQAPPTEPRTQQEQVVICMWRGARGVGGGVRWARRASTRRGRAGTSAGAAPLHAQ